MPGPYCGLVPGNTGSALGLSILVYKTEEKPLSWLRLHWGHSPSITQCCPHVKDYHHYHNQYGAVVRVMSSCMGVYAQKRLRAYETPVVLSLGEPLGLRVGGVLCALYTLSQCLNIFTRYTLFFTLIKREEHTACK